MPGRLDILPLGDRALVVEVADSVSEAATGRARRLAERVTHARLPGVREVVPAFCSMTVHYDPVVLCARGLPFDFAQGKPPNGARSDGREREQGRAGPGEQQEGQARAQGGSLGETGAS